jgi:hypothetical protein
MQWSVNVLVVYTLFAGFVSFLVAAFKARDPKALALYWAVGLVGAFVVLAFVKLVVPLLVIDPSGGY